MFVKRSCVQSSGFLQVLGAFFFFNTRAKKECYEAITLEYHILLRKDSIKILEARGMNVDTFLFFISNIIVAIWHGRT